MKERPLLFSGSMVRAILAGTKTQTRRVVKPQFAADAEPEEMCATNERGHQIAGHSGLWWCAAEGDGDAARRCPYGQPGDRLWVRESFCPIYPQDPHYNGGRPIEYDYQATYKHGDRLGDLIGVKKKWKPSIHMPRAASRITLEVTGVRVERLQDISEADAQAEGVVWEQGQTAANVFESLWESINGPGSWEANPWVWVVEFKRQEGGTA